MTNSTGGSDKSLPNRRVTGSQAAAFEQTLAALVELGQVAQVDEALVGLCRGLAAAVDAQPATAALWKEYREALTALRQAGESRDTDAFGELLAELRSSVGDASPS